MTAGLAAAAPSTLEALESDRLVAVQHKARRRGWLVRRALAAADIVGLVSAFVLAQYITGHTIAHDGLSALYQALGFAATLPAWIVGAKLHGLYRKDEESAEHSTVDDLVGVFQLVTLGTWIVYSFTRLTDIIKPQMDRATIFWALAILLVTLARFGARSLCRRSDTFVQRAVVVGTGWVADLVVRKLRRHPEYRVDLVGFIDDGGPVPAGNEDRLPVLGSVQNLWSIVSTLDIERVIVAPSADGASLGVDLVRGLDNLDVQIDLVPDAFEIIEAGTDVHSIEGLPVLSLPRRRLSSSSKLVKRGFDVIVSATALLLLAPVFFAVALAIKLDSRGPVIFRQQRMGASGGAFSIWKFRTMSADAEERKAEVAHLNHHASNGGDPRMFKIPRDPRITRVGAVLRRYFIDELPQLVNVLLGHMSLVGPRPLILEEHRYVQDWALRRLDLKPGMTGLWQVLGAGEIPFEEMVKLDFLYVTDWSLTKDLKLILRTIPALTRERVAV